MEYLALTPEQLGKILAAWRKSVGHTQQQLAAQVGMLQKSVSAIETNPDNVPIRQLFKVLSGLGLELAIRPKSGVQAGHRAGKPLSPEHGS